MTVNLLPLCSDTKVATVNGETTPTARTMGIGTRYWFRTGAIANFKNEYLASNKSTETAGAAKDAPYLKAVGVCGGAPLTFVYGSNPFGPCCYDGATEGEGGGGELP